MGRGGRNRRSGPRKNRYRLKSERGYLLISTLFFLVFSGLFSQSIIKISGNHLIQLRQLSTAYQAKSALNMSKGILLQKVDTGEIPKKGQINTSIGTVRIERSETEEEYTFKLTLNTNTSTTYSENVIVGIRPPEEEPEEMDVENEEQEEQENTEIEEVIEDELDAENEEATEEDNTEEKIIEEEEINPPLEETNEDEEIENE